MTTNNPNEIPEMPDEMPSPDELNDMLSSLLGGLGGGVGDPNDPNAPDPADLLSGLGDPNMLNDLMKGGGGMGQLTRMLGGGGLEKMMGDMMKQFEGMASPGQMPGGGVDAGQLTRLTAETIAEIPDMQLVNQIANHAHANMVAAYTDDVNVDEPTLADDVEAMLTLPEGQRALLATTRVMGSIKMEGMDAFMTGVVALEERVIDMAVTGFKLFGADELAELLTKAKGSASELVSGRENGAEYDVTDPLEDALTDLDDVFTEYDFLALHDQEVAFIRANPDLFVDAQ